MFREIFKMVEKKNTTAALIGTGHFGIAVIAQSLVTPELDIVAIADKNIDAIRNAAEKSGFGSDALVYANSVQEAKDAISEGRKVALTDPDILFSLDIDTIVEGTGNPEAGARHALKAIESGKNIVKFIHLMQCILNIRKRHLLTITNHSCTHYFFSFLFTGLPDKIITKLQHCIVLIHYIVLSHQCPVRIYVRPLFAL